MKRDIKMGQNSPEVLWLRRSNQSHFWKDLTISHTQFKYNSTMLCHSQRLCSRIYQVQNAGHLDSWLSVFKQVSCDFVWTEDDKI